MAFMRNKAAAQGSLFPYARGACSPSRRGEDGRLPRAVPDVPRPSSPSPEIPLHRPSLLASLALALGAPYLGAQNGFVNWETPHVSPRALTPDGTRLLAVNTPDNRLQVFDLTSGMPVSLAAIPVGLD